MERISIMRVCLKLLIVSMILVVNVKSGFSQSQKYNGIWILVKEKSDLGGIDAKIAAPNIMEIVLKPDSLINKRVFNDSLTYIDRWKIGAPDTESISSENTVRFSRVSMQSKTGPITIWNTYETNGAERVFWRTEEWDLISNGNELRMKRTTTLPDKVDRVVAIYRREK